jgi:hypothetical protein
MTFAAGVSEFIVVGIDENPVSVIPIQYREAVVPSMAPFMNQSRTIPGVRKLTWSAIPEQRDRLDD